MGTPTPRAAGFKQQLLEFIIGLPFLFTKIASQTEQSNFTNPNRNLFFFLLREGVQKQGGWTDPKNSNGPSLQLTTGYSWTAGPGQEKQTKEEAKKQSRVQFKN